MLLIVKSAVVEDEQAVVALWANAARQASRTFRTRHFCGN
jgi:hypothetical protein